MSGHFYVEEKKMSDDGPRVFSFAPGEVSMVDTFEGGAGYMSAIFGSPKSLGVGELSPALVFLLMETKQMGGKGPDQTRLVLTPRQALDLGAMLVEMGIAAVAMQSSGKAPTDIVDRV